MVGIPVLAQTRFAQGAAAFGFLISAYGFGNLGGMIVAGTWRRGPRPALVLGARHRLFVGFGLVIAALAFITSVWVGVALLAVLGVGNGYVARDLMTLVQRVTPTAMLGQRDEPRHARDARRARRSRTAVAGAVVGLGPDVLFVGCGAGMLAVAAVAALWPPLLVAGGVRGRRPARGRGRLTPCWGA